MATAMLTLLRHIARKRRVLIVVDDRQCSLTAAQTRTLLSFALRRLREEHVGLLAAVRTDWSADPSPMATDCVSAARMDRIRLGPLSLGATRELLATRTSRKTSGSRSICCRYTTNQEEIRSSTLELARPGR